MGRQRWAGELDRIDVARTGVRVPHRAVDQSGPGRAIDPIAREVLTLQAKAGNAAVARAIVAQRETEKERVARLQEAQTELRSMFPKEKLIQGVVIKDYDDLNDQLAGMGYGAWTQSKTEIFVRDPMSLEGVTQKNKRSALRYLLQHEVNHVRQFAQAKGPPKTWAAMLEFEIEAYTNDRKWLAANGKTEIPDAKLRKKFQDGVENNLRHGLEMQKTAAGKKDPEAFLFEEMKAREFIPKDAKPDPLELYKQ